MFHRHYIFQKRKYRDLLKFLNIQLGDFEVKTLGEIRVTFYGHIHTCRLMEPTLTQIKDGSSCSVATTSATSKIIFFMQTWILLSVKLKNSPLNCLLILRHDHCMIFHQMSLQVCVPAAVSSCDKTENQMRIPCTPSVGDN